MDAATALASLRILTQATVAPGLDDAELALVLGYAATFDAAGRLPSDAGWVPTYDGGMLRRRSAAEGWELKAGKASPRFDVSAGTTRATRSQTFKHCKEMAKRYRGGVVGSVAVATSLAGAAG